MRSKRPFSVHTARCSLHCAYYLKDGDSRPKVGHHVATRVAQLYDQGDPSTYTVHCAYYLKDRDSRPKVGHHVATRVAQLYDQGDPSTYTVHCVYYLKDRDSRPKVWYTRDSSAQPLILMSSCVIESFSPAATRIICSTKSMPVMCSVIGCSTWTYARHTVHGTRKGRG